MVSIFDLDGTLVDSSITLANAVNYVRGKLNLPPLPKDEILEKINDPYGDIAYNLYGVREIEPIYEEWFKEYYSKNHSKELVLFDGIRELLETLKRKGLKLAIATNGYRDSTIEALKHLNILNYFDTIVTFDDVKSPKPAPDMLLKIVNDLNIPKERAIFVGDSQRDYLASKNANIRFIGVDFINKKSDAKSLLREIKRALRVN